MFEPEPRTLVDNVVLSSFVEAVALYVLGPGLPAGSPGLAEFACAMGGILLLIVFTLGSMMLVLASDAEMPGMPKRFQSILEKSDGAMLPELVDVDGPVSGLTFIWPSLSSDTDACDLTKWMSIHKQSIVK